MRQTGRVSDAFARAINDLDEEAFQLLYGRWDPLEPEQVADLLSALTGRWCIAGGRAARVGATARQHDDTDVVVRADDLDELRKALQDWHLWEANSGTLRPLLPGAALTEGCDQLWARRNAQEPWQLDLLLDRSGDEWVFKRGASRPAQRQSGSSRSAARPRRPRLAGSDAGNARPSFMGAADP